VLALSWHAFGTPSGYVTTDRRQHAMADRRGEIADTVRQRILSGLHVGTLRPGERLPSTRVVAKVQQVARRLGKPAITVSLRPELMTELTRQLSAGRHRLHPSRDPDPPRVLI